jgi:hypothetical protein
MNGNFIIKLWELTCLKMNRVGKNVNLNALANSL